MSNQRDADGVTADVSPATWRRSHENKRSALPALSASLKEELRIDLFELVLRAYPDPDTAADVMRRAAIAMGISESEPTLPELPPDERRYCLDEATLHVIMSPDCPAPSDPDGQALFDLAVDIHYERLSLLRRWELASPGQRGPIIRRSLQRRMGML